MPTDRKLLNNGIILLPREKFNTSYQGDDNENIRSFSNSSVLEINPLFRIRANNVPAGSNYLVQCLSTTDPHNSINPTGAFPADWVTLERTTPTSVLGNWAGTTDGSGGINDVVQWNGNNTFVFQNLFHSLSRPLGSMEPYSHAAVYGNGQVIDDPDDLVDKRALGYSYPTAYEEEGVNYRLYIRVIEITAVFRLLITGSVDKTTTVKFWIPVAVDELTDDTENVVQDLITLDIDFDQEFSEVSSATRVDSSVQQTNIPYTKTSERDVVHLDYRLKS